MKKAVWSACMEKIPASKSWRVDSADPAVSVVLPCLNGATTVAATVREARPGVANAGLSGEVLVVDNGSTDDSAPLAQAAGARVVREAPPAMARRCGAALRRPAAISS